MIAPPGSNPCAGHLSSSLGPTYSGLVEPRNQSPRGTRFLTPKGRTQAIRNRHRAARQPGRNLRDAAPAATHVLWRSLVRSDLATAEVTVRVVRWSKPIGPPRSLASISILRASSIWGSDGAAKPVMRPPISEPKRPHESAESEWVIRRLRRAFARFDSVVRFLRPENRSFGRPETADFCHG